MMISLPILITEKLSASFWARVQKGDGCWGWLGKINDSGYGILSVSSNRSYRAHRFSFFLHNQEDQKSGFVIDHICNNRRCVNPTHLQQIMHKENSLRGVGYCAIQKRKTHCIRGHELIPKNLYKISTRPNERQCKICGRIRRLGLHK